MLCGVGDGATSAPAAVKLGFGNFLTVSRLFQACNRCPLAGGFIRPDTLKHVIETASWSRRILALIVDWFACIFVVMLLIGPKGWVEDPNAGFYTLLAFVVQSAILIALAGGSFGQLVTGLRVIGYEQPRPVGLLQALLRQVLIALVIPPLVFRPDGRGLHDLAVKSAVVRVADLRR